MSISITNIIENIKQIEAIPCYTTKNDGFINNERVDRIDKIIKDSDCEYRQVKGHKYYRLYGKYDLETMSKKYNDICLVSIHADNWQELSSFKELDNDKINGCFDNAACIGCAISLMTTTNLPDNVMFVFTSCEETTGIGAKRASKKINEYFDNVEEITLDVTYGFRNGVDFTFENDFLRRNITNKEDLCEMFNSFHDSNFRWDCVFAMDEEDDNNKYITVPELKELMGESGGKAEESDGDDDESHIYKNKKFSSFSFCLPCSAENCAEMHSPKGFVISKNTLVRYTLALHTVLCALGDNSK